MVRIQSHLFIFNNTCGNTEFLLKLTCNDTLNRIINKIQIKQYDKCPCFFRPGLGIHDNIHEPINVNPKSET